MRTEHLPLPSIAPGNQRHLILRRYGPIGERVATLQAALHADELPGLLVLHHLEQRLNEAEARGELRGEIRIFPFANPIGLSQMLLGTAAGRYEQNSGENFNRYYADLSEMLLGRLEGKLGANAQENIQIIRREMVQCLQIAPGTSELDTLRRHLLRWSIDADIVLDLHCDFSAILHLYLGTPHWPAAADLAADLGAEVSLTAEVSGGNPFDEAAGGPWWALARRFPKHPIPPACFSATVELRGMMDVEDAYAQQDAAALYRFLQRRGFIAGDPGPLAPLKAEATPLEGVAMLRTAHTGLMVWRVPVGAQVKAGEHLGDVVDIEQPGQRYPIDTPISGTLYGRVAHALVHSGQIVGKIAGQTAFRSGKLLTD